MRRTTVRVKLMEHVTKLNQKTFHAVPVTVEHDTPTEGGWCIGDNYAVKASVIHVLERESIKAWLLGAKAAGKLSKETRTGSLSARDTYGLYLALTAIDSDVYTLKAVARLIGCSEAALKARIRGGKALPPKTEDALLALTWTAHFPNGEEEPCYDGWKLFPVEDATCP